MNNRIRIKICGITNLKDALEAARLGADAIGINFASESPRCTEGSVAQQILKHLPPFVDPVGVYVNRLLADIFTEAQRLGIRMIQWHGDSEKRELTDPFPFRLIAAFSIRDQKSLVQAHRYLELCRSVGRLPSAVLLDGHAAGQYGGTGQTAPWEKIASFKPPDVPVILAGGLTPENVGEAISVVRPYGVDVASGVESSPGQKDIHKMAQFVYNARLAASQLRD